MRAKKLQFFLFFTPTENDDETVESLAYDPVNKMLLWTDGFNRSIRQVQIDNDGIHAKENTSVEIVHLLESDARPQALVSDPCTRYSNKLSDLNCLFS
jgi:hypothetical protein